MTNLVKRFLIKLNYKDDKYFFISSIFIKKVLKVLLSLSLLASSLLTLPSSFTSLSTLATCYK